MKEACNLTFKKLLQEVATKNKLNRS